MAKRTHTAHLNNVLINSSLNYIRVCFNLLPLLCVCVCVCVYKVASVMFNSLQPCQAPLSMGFFRQEYWSGLPCPPPGHLPDPGIEPISLKSPALAGEFFTTRTQPGKPGLSWVALESALGIRVLY